MDESFDPPDKPLTVAKLRELLTELPDDMEVQIGCVGYEEVCVVNTSRGRLIIDHVH